MRILLRNCNKNENNCHDRETPLIIDIQKILSGDLNKLV